ncbi:dihydrodipicolinate synthase family protein [Clostridium algidicarnis]|uniref:dihydrodipicolinate synthase family protein n=1 Tax=Clostridium algidicarnis TaxID=37659 RepID=UPI001C0D7C94|nr:dihydrodipicolinate synthase family protein [Clostridium algidicarnis]MBU3197564.1 dihydrodipicolinate synthase family protein [Clostridium algidicarnis]MBU3210674.1 dihydrodipicolinate synthase family protein [Clostridium algidicarnis]MBU3229125.1 dihydrodipicolinate synthase family protein [Clostridium algidicarnis]MBU3252642.1 dihydrodipicolinate synthase family protein [Clostridium algidicarnis]
MNFNKEDLKGIFVAFYACFDNDNNISEEATKKLARFYATKGVKGLYVGGSSGEGFLLTVEERKKMLEAVMDEVGSELKIIVHVGAAATRDSIELSKHAKKVGAYALSAVPNVYYKIPERSIELHWKSIMDSADLPFIIYNIPQTTGYDLSINLLKKMLSYPNVVGIKNSSMSTYDIQKFKAIGGKDLLVFNGPDEQYISGRIMGADSGIGGTYGVMPELFLKAEEYFSKGNIEKAKEVQFAINDIIGDLLSFPSLYGVAKEIVKLRGVDIGTTRLPLEPVDKEDFPKVKELYEKIMNTIEKFSA